METMCLGDWVVKSSIASQNCKRISCAGGDLSRHDQETTNRYTVKRYWQGLPMRTAIRAVVEFSAIGASKDLVWFCCIPGNGDHHVVLWSGPRWCLPVPAGIGRAGEDAGLTLETRTA